MPNAFKSVSSGPDNKWCFLASFGSVMQRSQIVAYNIKCIKHIVQILNLGNRTKSAKCHTNTLTNNGCFPYTGICNARFAIFFLQAFQTLVYITNSTRIFAKNKDFRVFVQQGIKIIPNDGACIYQFGIVAVNGFYFGYIYGRSTGFVI